MADPGFEPVAEIVPEGDAELGTGLGEAEQGVATIAAVVAARAAADLALGDMAADVALRTIGVQRYLGPVEDGQQLGLVGMQPRQPAVASGESCSAPEEYPSAEGRLPKFLHFVESDLIFGEMGVSRSVHKTYGHKADRTAAQSLVAGSIEAGDCRRVVCAWRVGFRGCAALRRQREPSLSVT